MSSVQLAHKKVPLVGLTPKFSCSRVKQSERSEQSVNRLSAATFVGQNDAREARPMRPGVGRGQRGVREHTRVRAELG